MSSLTPNHWSPLLSRLRADQSERWRRGESVRVEHYLEHYPDLADDAAVLLDLIHAERLYRLQSGEQPSLEEYLKRFPPHADALRRSWPQALPIPQPRSESDACASTVPQEPTSVIIARPAAPLLLLPGLELHEKLGEGGMGTVYRARDVRLDQPRAVKVIRTGPFTGADAHDRFSREAKAAARLDHAGVVRIYALGEHADVLYICMELLEGGSLHARLRQGPLEIRAAADLVRQLALAVQHAHDNRVLHRDLKPANVLLTAHGTPKVGDFGLAKLLDADDGLTQAGAVMGTPSYMAPEQAEGRLGDVRERTDVYALGAILYECLGGRPPFKSASRSQTLELVKTQPPAPLRRLRAEVPAELEAICLKCLEKQPGQRPATAAALAADLQDWLDGKERQRPARRLRRLVGGLRRRPRRIVLAGFVLLAGIAAAWLWSFAHPDRPLWQTQAQLRRGEAVELIGGTGKPRWSRWWLGEKDAKSLVGEDGTFVVQGWPLTLVELLPGTCGHSHYHLHAQVRHIRTGANGAVGLYFAGASQGTAGGRVLSFLQVDFDDLHSAVDQYNRFPEEFRKWIPQPRANRVRVLSRIWAGGAPRPTLNLAMTYVEPELFSAAGLAHAGKPGDWRSLRVEVAPSRLRVFFDGKLVGAVNPARVQEQFAHSLRQRRLETPDNPALAGPGAQLDLQGGMGLYLYESCASFRNVRVEPQKGGRQPD